MKDRIPTYPGRVTLTPVAGQANTYDLVRADAPTEPGTPLNKANLLADSTAEALGLDPENNPTPNDAFAALWPRAKTASPATLAKYPGATTPDEALAALATQAGPWVLIQSYTTAGAVTWTVPDIYGDGLPYQIGVYLIGGGGSGGIGIYNPSWAEIKYASGGGSGHARAFTLTVTPGSVISGTVGAGGAAVTGGYSYLSGNNGGSSSFGGVTVLGGDGGLVGVALATRSAGGGQAADTPASLGQSSTAPAMGRLPLFYSGINPGLSNILECLNIFNGKRYLAAGGAAYTITPDNAAKQDAVTLDDGYTTGASVSRLNASAVAPAATGHGNGGGAAASYTNTGTVYTATSGAGSKGAVFIYARKVSV